MHPTEPVHDRPGDARARATVDLNADLGESFGAWSLGDDDAMLALVTSANVACGFHAGDPLTIRRTCAAAARAGVSVGAHVGYRDLAGFGRRFLDVTPDELTTDVVYQIGALTALARSAGTTVRYVKPHGALYTAIVDHREQARAVVAAVVAVDPALPLLTLPGAVVADEARAAGLRVVTEAFVDRAYTRAGTLASRRVPGAVLDDPQAVAARAVRLAVDGTVETIDGGVVQVRADSLCVHGDTPGAVAMAAAVRRSLAEAGVGVAAFT